MTAAILLQIDRANRLRWRALLLDLRATSVRRLPGQADRAQRIQERAERIHLRASIAHAALHNLTAAS